MMCQKVIGARPNSLAARCGRSVALVVFLLGSIALFPQSIPYPPQTRAENAPAREAFLDGDFTRARDLAISLTRQNPANDEAWFILGRVASYLEEWKTAQDAMDKARALVPLNVAYNLWYAQAFGETVRELNPFEALAKVGDFKKLCQETVAKLPAEPEIRQILILFLITAPGIAGGDMDEAKRQIDAVKKLDPGYGLRMEALWFNARGDDTQAEATFRKAATYGQSRTLASWAQWLSGKHRYKDALALLRDWRSRVDNPGYMDWLLGWCIAESGLAEKEPDLGSEGLAALDRYLQAPWQNDTPPKAKAWYQKARILKAIKNKTGARAALAEALRILPGYPKAKDLLASL